MVRKIIRSRATGERHGYHVKGGFVQTARCKVCGGTYTKGMYSYHVRESHVGHLYRRK